MAESMLPPLILELRARAGQLYSELQKASAAVKTNAAETEAAAGRTTRAVEGSAAATEASAARASTAWTRLTRMGKVAAVGVGAAAIAIGVESVKMASKFQSQMSLLVTAGGESEKNLGAISNGVLSIARATGTSTDQLAEGMYTVAKATASTGTSVADQLKILKAAAEGAKAENVDMATSVNALTSVMMSYHRPAADAVAVQNQMIAASGLAKTTMSNFAGALSTVLPVASAAGVSFAEVGGAIATLTQHGTSADEATQELSNTIRNLQAPNAVAQKAMQQLGIGVNDLSQGLSTRGLTGTIQMVTDAIKNHMGPAGLVVVDSFNKSATATADLNKMLKSMPPDLAKLSQGLLDGSVSYKEYQKAAKDSGGQSEAMALQFLSLQKSSQGFNQMLKSGTADERTAAASLRDIMGGATGMNTALMLGGENMAYFKKATEEVAAAGKHAGDNISTWARTQKNFSVQMSQLREDVQTAAIAVGTWLLPKVQAFVGFLTDHTAILYTVGGLIGGFLVLAITAWMVALGKAAVKNIADMVKMSVAAVKWVATQAASIAQSLALWAMYAAEWVARQAVSIAQSVRLWAMYAGEWIAKQATSVAQSLALWAMYGAQWIARTVTAAAQGFASMVAAGAAWALQTARQVAASIAAGAAWIAEHVTMAAVAVASYGAMAAAALAAWVAENAATLGIAALITLLVGAIVWLATHWSQAWGAITSAAKWAYDNVILPVARFIDKYAIQPIAGAIQWLGGIWQNVWNWIVGAVRDAYNFIAGIIDKIIGAVKSAIGWLQNMSKGMQNVANQAKQQSGAGGFGIQGLEFMGYLPTHDKGGWIEGPPGQPIPILAHGAEYMLSREMLTGAQRIDPQVLAAIAGQQQRATAPAPAPAMPAPPGGGPTVIVQAQTNASPHRIAADVGWVLRAMA